MLSFDEYKAQIKALPFGKRVGKNVYVSRPDLCEASPALANLLEPLSSPEETTPFATPS